MKNHDEIRTEVRNHYSSIARGANTGCCGTGAFDSEQVGYSKVELSDQRRGRAASDAARDRKRELVETCCAIGLDARSGDRSDAARRELHRMLGSAR